MAGYVWPEQLVFANLLINIVFFISLRIIVKYFPIKKRNENMWRDFRLFVLYSTLSLQSNIWIPKN